MYNDSTNTNTTKYPRRSIKRMAKSTRRTNIMKIHTCSIRDSSKVKLLSSKIRKLSEKIKEQQDELEKLCNSMETLTLKKSKVKNLVEFFEKKPELKVKFSRDSFVPQQKYLPPQGPLPKPPCQVTRCLKNSRPPYICTSPLEQKVEETEISETKMFLNEFHHYLPDGAPEPRKRESFINRNIKSIWRASRLKFLKF